MLGPGKAIDTDKYFVVSANMLGSCYGTTGPATARAAADGGASAAGDGAALPAWAPRAARAQRGRATATRRLPLLHAARHGAAAPLLVDRLGVRSVHAVVGGSAGGMQALEWALMYPALVERVVAIACGATQSAWQVAISEAQRQAIYRDARWARATTASDAPPSEGLAVARQEAMIWYRSHEAYDAKFGRRPQPAELERTKSSAPRRARRGTRAPAAARVAARRAAARPRRAEARELLGRGAGRAPGR